MEADDTGPPEKETAAEVRASSGGQPGGKQGSFSGYLVTTRRSKGKIARELKDFTRLCLLLLKNGYFPTPLGHKTDPMWNWPKMAVSVRAILGWDRSERYDKCIGIQLRNRGLVVGDCDVQNQKAMDELAKLFMDYLGLDESPPIRFGKPVCEAWLFRLEGPAFDRYASRRWIDPETGKTSCVEIFGGGSDRYFGWYGVHSYHKDGTIAFTYECDGNIGPHNAPKSRLIKINARQAAGLCDIANKYFKELGWELASPFKACAPYGGRVYDIKDGVTFRTKEYGTLTMEEAKAMAADDHDMDVRCDASFLEPSTNTMRCRMHSNKGKLWVWDNDDGNCHYLEEDKPRPVEDLSEAVAALAAKLALLGIKVPGDAA